MKTYTKEEVLDMSFNIFHSNEVDNDGQYVIYTDVYKWSDGTFRDYAEEGNSDLTPDNDEVEPDDYQEACACGNVGQGNPCDVCYVKE